MRNHLFILLTILVVVGTSSCTTDYQLEPGNRTKYNFNPDWKFIQENPENAHEVSFEDGNWKTISCPHTFNDVDTFDDLSHGHHDGEDNQWRGTVWYRKHFSLPKEDEGKKVFIEFESVRQIADVYINGQHIGQNQTGFIPFGFDLTKYISFGEDNVIAVKVNNDREDHFRKNFPLVWNHEHWHPTHGGIYRNVFLHTMDPLHITLPLFDNIKTVGTYVYAEEISKKSAEVYVEAEIFNEYTTAKSVDIASHVIDAKGQIVSTCETSQKLDPKEKRVIRMMNKISNPHLWYTRDPYMYKVVTEIKDGSVTIDSYETPLGIRTFEFNKDSGYYNNGEYVKLHGWGQKPTNSWAGLGAALPDWLREYTYQLMDEAGGNFIRWGHCAGSPAEIAMGDKYGFVTLMPGVSGESADEGETWDVRIAAFRDMIVYYRNHPSIMIWEGGNWAESAEHYEEILETIKRFDPKGKRLMGNRRADVSDVSEKYVTIEIGTEGWEGEYTHLPIIESEYCRDEAPRRVWDKYSPDDNYWSHPNISKNTYKMASETFAVKQAEHWWKKMGKKPYHSGGANWIFTDGPHGGRCPTEVTRASGEVDAVRLPKEAFYALKAMWRPEPQVHIVGHWNYEVGTTKDMFVISNCAAVKLYINDELIGFDSIPDNGYVYKFPKVTWQAGEIRAEATIGGELRASQVKETIGEPASIKLSSITGPQGWRADGSDVALIDVEIVDANGDRCPLAKGRVDFTISGPAIWRGGYNSGKANSTNNLYLDIEAGINRVAVRSTLEPGTVTVTAEYDGLKQTSIDLTSQEIQLMGGLTTELPQVSDVIAVAEPLPAYTPEMPPYVPGVSNKSKLFKKFSYTGDSPAKLRTDIFWGKKAYTDLPYNYTVIPKYLVGGEYIRMPNADARYWARDQLQFIAGADMTIYVGHDDRIERPEFLREDYIDTGDNFKLDEVTMSLYKREAKAGESIVMAGNSDGDMPEGARMYVVIGKRR
ncbi:MAG: DUF4982 domain-containing protein [Cyclobacteriaceae bacterium]